MQILNTRTIILALLADGSREHYGVSLIKIAETRGFRLLQSRVYPLLTKLRRQGLVKSRQEKKGYQHAGRGRPRRYFQITHKGKQAALKEWTTIKRLYR
jgi:DNA-binding PadR family transcriptional regulator